jgi:UDP-glucose 4-epimerase
MVVGGAGFIGSHLVDRLLAEQYSIDVVDDLSTGGLGNLASARAAGGELKIHHLDAGADEFVALVAMREPEVIVHLGLLPPGRSGTGVLTGAVRTTLQVIDASRRSGPAKVVVGLPAGALYGDVPSREQPVKEGREFAPTDERGVVARTVVELLTTARRVDEVEFTALALGTVYGPRQRRDGGVVAAFAAALAEGRPGTIDGDGRQTRDFVYIDDVVDAFVRATQRGSGLVVNVGTGVATSIRDLWTAMAGAAGPIAQIGTGPATGLSRMAVSPTRARIHLSWAPWTDLATGLHSLSSQPHRT